MNVWRVVHLHKKKMKPETCRQLTSVIAFAFHQIVEQVVAENQINMLSELHVFSSSIKLAFQHILHHLMLDSI